jgi:hypothetical protein
MRSELNECALGVDLRRIDWESEIAAAGKLYLTMNAGCFRLLVPQIHACRPF